MKQFLSSFGQELNDLIRHADAAMYSAKQSRRGQYRFFDPSLNLSDVEEFALEQALGAALNESRFVQPDPRLKNIFASNKKKASPRTGLNL